MRNKGMRFPSATGPLVLVFSLAFLCSAGSALADPTGNYGLTGTNPDDGQKYVGTVSVIRNGDTYKVSWNVGDETIVGTGIEADGHFSVAYESNESPGIANLTRHPDGSYTGIWSVTGFTQKGTEIWQPAKQYAVSGVGTDGKKYTGSVAVVKLGDIFQVVRTIAGKEYIGIGIGSDGNLDIGFKFATATIVAHFDPQPDGSWKGTLATANETRVSTEQWLPFNAPTK